MSVTTAEPLVHRSVSQWKEFTQCPHRFYLRRIQGVWERPAAWLPQGLAVHEAVEAYEKSGRSLPEEDVVEVFQDRYAVHTNRLAEITPNFRWWFPSGRYVGAVDVQRRFHLGIEQTRKYLEFATNSEDRIWATPDGHLAVEWGFDTNLGGVRVKGFIDQIIITPSGDVVVRDIKTGNRPGDVFQLAVYRVVVEKTFSQHGISVSHGDFWMGRTGRPGRKRDLTEWPEDRIGEEFFMLDEEIKKGVFEPRPSLEGCRMCPVATACEFGGARA